MPTHEQDATNRAIMKKKQFLSVAQKSAKTTPGMQTERKIMDVAVSLFSEQGYKATTMRQIAGKVNITAGSLYNHVRSKEELFLAIQKGFMDDLLAKTKKCRSKESAKEKLRSVVEVLMETIAEDRLAWQNLVDQHHHFTALQRNELRLISDELDHMIREIVEEGKRRGEFRDVDTRFASFFLLGACHHAAKWLNSKGDVSAKEVGRQFASYFLNGLSNSNTFESCLDRLVSTG
jgi:AcrR family transcriptional regulator